MLVFYGRDKQRETREIRERREIRKRPELRDHGDEKRETRESFQKTQI